MAKAIYKIDGSPVAREHFYEAYVYLLEESESFRKEFDELLDELYEPVEILGQKFSPSSVIQEMDYTTYEMALTEQAEFTAKDHIDNAELWEEDFHYDTLDIEFVEEDEDEEE